MTQKFEPKYKTSYQFLWYKITQKNNLYKDFFLSNYINIKVHKMYKCKNTEKNAYISHFTH